MLAKLLGTMRLLHSRRVSMSHRAAADSRFRAEELGAASRTALAKHTAASFSAPPLGEHMQAGQHDMQQRCVLRRAAPRCAVCCLRGPAAICASQKIQIAGRWRRDDAARVDLLSDARHDHGHHLDDAIKVGALFGAQAPAEARQVDPLLRAVPLEGGPELEVRPPPAERAARGEYAGSACG